MSNIGSMVGIYDDKIRIPAKWAAQSFIYLFIYLYKQMYIQFSILDVVACMSEPKCF